MEDRGNMRILSYSGESVLTTDGVGEAVVDYARALIADNSADVIDIPVLLKKKVLTASMLLGPASQLILVPCLDIDVELRDDLTIARLRSKIAALKPHKVLPIESSEFERDELALDDL
jgi:hypothetical protein